MGETQSGDPIGPWPRPLKAHCAGGLEAALNHSVGLQGLGFRVWLQDLGFRVWLQGLGFGVRVQDLRFKVYGLGFRAMLNSNFGLASEN